MIVLSPSGKGLDHCDFNLEAARIVQVPAFQTTAMQRLGVIKLQSVAEMDDDLSPPPENSLPMPQLLDLHLNPPIHPIARPADSLLPFPLAPIGNLQAWFSRVVHLSFKF